MSLQRSLLNKNQYRALGLVLKGRYESVRTGLCADLVAAENVPLSVIDHFYKVHGPSIESDFTRVTVGFHGLCL